MLVTIKNLVNLGGKQSYVVSREKSKTIRTFRRGYKQ